jgi:iron complex transport system substrate-binding protein
MARTSTRIGAAAFAAVVALAACGGDADGGGDDGAASADDGDGASSGWTYTDGSGTETTLDDVPTRIVAHSTSAAALMSFGITPVGIYADTTVEDELTLQGVDLDGIEIVGEEWGEINVEAVAALDPDIIVSEWWPVEQGYTGMEPGAGTGLETMREIAPVVGVAQSTSIVGMIEDYAELAESLGVDLDEPDVAASREAFDDAVASFEAAVEAQPDLSVLAVSPTEESLYVAVPEHSAELSDFTD